MIINLLCKALIAILDILLLDFYLKNIYPDLYKNKFKNVKFIIYLIIFIFMLFVRNSITYFFIHILILIFLSIIYSFFHVNKIEFISKIIVYYFLLIIIHILVLFFLAWLYNTLPLFFYPNYSFPYIIINP